MFKNRKIGDPIPKELLELMKEDIESDIRIDISSLISPNTQRLLETITQIYQSRKDNNLF